MFGVFIQTDRTTNVCKQHVLLFGIVQMIKKAEA